MKLESSGEAEVGVIQITNDSLTRRQIRDICDNLRRQNLTVLALRECTIRDEDFKRLVRAISVCQSLLQINFNLNLVDSEERVTLLARCLRKNTSIKSLYLHGSDLSGENLEILVSSLKRHPSLISLDLGDSGLEDSSMEYIIPMLSPKGQFQGLIELGLSGNDSVSGAGWCRLFQALAATHQTCRLSALYLDYCRLGDTAVTCLATAMAALATLRTVDLECTGITDTGAQFLLYLVENQRENRLEIINLHRNDLDPRLVQAIDKRLQTAPSPSIESESESEPDFTTSLVTDPEKLEALNTLTRALAIYSKQLLDEENGEENGEELVDKEMEEGVMAVPTYDLADDEKSDDDDNASRITLKSLTSKSDTDDDDDDDAPVYAKPVRPLKYPGSMQTNGKSTAKIAETAQDDVITNDVITQDQSAMTMAEMDDEGDFLKEVYMAPNYTVIQPVTILSRASAGYFF